MTVLKPIYLEKNKGLGNALRKALDNCSYNLVARMDSDDISFPLRFEKQLEVFSRDSNIDVVGGSITEFAGEPDNITGLRDVELDDAAIRKDMKKRCAMNHVAVMYKKMAVQEAGGYIDWYYNEDYYLWIRMLEHNCKFANVPYPLVNVRTGANMSARRGGWRYFKSEKGIQSYMLRHGQISYLRYLYNVGLRLAGEVIMPNSLRELSFRLFRSSYNPKTTENVMERNTGVLKKSYPPFSVAMCVYGKDKAEWFDLALRSVTLDQTVKPDEIVLVVDGPVPREIQTVIDKYIQLLGGVTAFHVIYLQENKGHGSARRIGVERCSHELVALMDSDDISLENRFEIQIHEIISQKADIIGGSIAEFINTPDCPVSYRVVPSTDVEIKQYMKKRCPMNQVTVMFRKSAVLSAGGYLDWYCDEDYYLWIRMALHEARFVNTRSILVNVRIGEDMYKRRGGWKYFKSELNLQGYMLRRHVIGLPRYIVNVAERLVLQILLPGRTRGWVFSHFARSKSGVSGDIPLP